MVFENILFLPDVPATPPVPPPPPVPLQEVEDANAIDELFGFTGK